MQMTIYANMPEEISGNRDSTWWANCNTKNQPPSTWHFQMPDEEFKILILGKLDELQEGTESDLIS